MRNFDKQRVAAHRKLEDRGYSYRDGECVPPASSKGEAVTATIADSDTMIAPSCRCARMRVRISMENCLAQSVTESDPHLTPINLQDPSHDLDD